MYPPLGWAQHMHMQRASNEAGGGWGWCPPPVGLHRKPGCCLCGQPHPLAVLAPIGSSSWDLCSQSRSPREQPWI